MYGIMKIQNQCYSLNVRNHPNGVIFGVADPELEISMLIKTEDLHKVMRVLEEKYREANLDEMVDPKNSDYRRKRELGL